MDFSEILASVLTWFGPSNTTIFKRAVRSGDVGIVNEMLTKGVDVNTIDGYGDSALIYAARQHNTELVRLLLDSGANVLYRPCWSDRFVWDLDKHIIFDASYNIYVYDDDLLRKILTNAAKNRIMEITGLSLDLCQNVVSYL